MVGFFPSELGGCFHSCFMQAQKPQALSHTLKQLMSQVSIQHQRDGAQNVPDHQVKYDNVNPMSNNPPGLFGVFSEGTLLAEYGIHPGFFSHSSRHSHQHEETCWPLPGTTNMTLHYFVWLNQQAALDARRLVSACAAVCLLSFCCCASKSYQLGLPVRMYIFYLYYYHMKIYIYWCIYHNKNRTGWGLISALASCPRKSMVAHASQTAAWVACFKADLGLILRILCLPAVERFGACLIQYRERIIILEGIARSA